MATDLKKLDANELLEAVAKNLSVMVVTTEDIMLRKALNVELVRRLNFYDRSREWPMFDATQFDTTKNKDRDLRGE